MIPKNPHEEEEEDVLLGQALQAPFGPPVLDPTLPSWIFAAGIERQRRAPSSPPASRPRRRPRDEELLATGSIVDKYRIDGLLGKGGFATVYKATHMLLGTRVALKLLRPTILRRQPNLGAQLCAEARFAARINHPNVVRVLDVTSHALTYIVMEYIDGMSLNQRIHRHGTLAPAELLRAGLQIVAGLEAGLEQGLIHRDIKPANILLARNGDVKIVDFGLARHTAEPTDAPRPQGRMVIGTYGYMSPEQADDADSVDFRADVYSLGVTLHEAACGGLPFPIGEHRAERTPRLDEIVLGFPTAAASVVAWMLAAKREERPPSYSALYAAMMRALATFGSTR